jgi:hypothetical protein
MGRRGKRRLVGRVGGDAVLGMDGWVEGLVVELVIMFALNHNPDVPSVERVEEAMAGAAGVAD